VLSGSPTQRALLRQLSHVEPGAAALSGQANTIGAMCQNHAGIDLRSIRASRLGRVAPIGREHLTRVHQGLQLGLTLSDNSILVAASGECVEKLTSA